MINAKLDAKKWGTNNGAGLIKDSKDTVMSCEKERIYQINDSALPRLNPSKVAPQFMTVSLVTASWIVVS